MTSTATIPAATDTLQQRAGRITRQQPSTVVDLGVSRFPHAVLVVGHTPTDTLHLLIPRTAAADVVADLDVVVGDDARFGRVLAGDCARQWGEPDTRDGSLVSLHVDVDSTADPLDVQRCALLVLCVIGRRTSFQQSAGVSLPSLSVSNPHDWRIAHSLHRD